MGASAAPHRMNLRLLQLDRTRLSDWRHWLPASVEVVAVVLLAAQAARLLWMVLVPVAPVGTAAAAIGLQAAAPALPTVDVFFHRASTTRGSGTDQALGYTLHGVRSDGEGGSAILGRDGRQASHAVGNAIAPGITLESVAADHAVLVAGGERHRLQLPRRAKATAARTSSRPSSTASSARASQPATAPRSTPAPAAGVATDPRPPPPPSSRATAHAQSQEGGYIVTSGGDGALLRQAGLQTGDVVLSVNGRPLDPARIGALAKELRGQSQATIRYRRDDRIHTTTVKAPQ